MASITINTGREILSYYITEEEAGTFVRFIEDRTSAMAEDITPLLAALPPLETDYALFDLGSDYDEYDDEEYDDDDWVDED